MPNQIQQLGFNPEFNDAYKDAFALSGEAIRAETKRKDELLLKTRGRTKEVIQSPLNIQTQEYARIMNQYNALLGLKTKDERRTALSKMSKEDKGLMVKALRFRDLVRKMDEQERLSMANEEIHFINLEKELFGDLEAKLSNSK